MKQSRVATRYAKALLQLSIEQGVLIKSYNDMLLLENACSASRDLLLLLRSPIVKTEHKLKIFQLIFEKKISTLGMDFVNIIIRKKRESILDQVAKRFISLYKKYNNIETAQITTAVPISEDLKTNLINYLKAQTHNAVELKEVVDEKLIGGAIITMDDKQLDLSISTEISELRQTFNKNLYLQDL